MGAAMPMIAIASTVIGTGLQVYGQIQQAQSQQAAANYQAQVARFNQQAAERNQRLSERNAQYAEAAGARAMDDRTRRIRQVIGGQRAAAAANNLLPGEGTPALLQQDTSRLGDLALAELRENAARTASGYRIQGLNAQDEAALAGSRGEFYAAAGRDAGTAGWLSAGASLIGGATRTFDRWADMQRTGVPMMNPPMVT